MSYTNTLEPSVPPSPYCRSDIYFGEEEESEDSEDDDEDMLNLRVKEDGDRN